MKPLLDALDERLAAAGWTCSMVQYWRALRRLGWSAATAAWFVKREAERPTGTSRSSDFST